MSERIPDVLKAKKSPNIGKNIEYWLSWALEVLKIKLWKILKEATFCYNSIVRNNNNACFFSLWVCIICMYVCNSFKQNIEIKLSRIPSECTKVDQM